MRPVLIIGVILLVVVVGVPLVGAMTMPFCPECPSAGWGPGAFCLAVLASLLLIVPRQALALRRRANILVSAGLHDPPERPPQLA